MMSRALPQSHVVSIDEFYKGIFLHAISVRIIVSRFHRGICT